MKADRRSNPLAVAATGLILFAAVAVSAGEIVATTDGRRIELRDDGTFRIVPRLKPSDPPTYQPLTVQDIAVDARTLDGRLVEVGGWLVTIISGTNITNLALHDSPSMHGVNLSVRSDELTGDQKRAIFQKCPLVCKAVIRGELRVVSSGSQHHYPRLLPHDLRLTDPLGR